MINYLKPIMIVFCCCFAFAAKASELETANEWRVQSPDKNLQLTLKLNDGRLSYTVQNGTVEIMPSSRLGIETSDTKFTEQLSFVSLDTKRINDIYVLPTGKYRVYHAFGNQTSVTFKNAGASQMIIDMQAYNDGVAFRYRFSEANKTYTITKELTEFSVPQAAAWIQPYDHDPSYEDVFTNGAPSGTASKDSAGWAFPALFHTKDQWLQISESNIGYQNAGMHLQQNCEGGVYKIAFPLAGEGLGQGSSYPVAKTPFATPWRVIIAGNEPSTVVQSALINHLAEPNAIGNTDWIKPGRSSWSWWSDHASSRNVSTLNRFVDLAANMKWEYSLVDANWNILQGGGSIQDVINHAKEKKVGLTFWYNSGGPHNNVTEQPRDVMFDPIKRKEEFKKLHNWGVKAVKVDFFQSDKQNVMQLYQDILKDAASEQIMVIFHGSTMPRGWVRTYPNLLSMESVKGAENYGWSKEFANDAAQANTVYVFTRNVTGSMDYTPVIFSDYKCCPHVTTNAHELALSVVFESGMMHFADSDSSYYRQDAKVKQYLSTVPNTWDDVKLISGQPGKDAVLMRRKGKSYYIAGINGEATAKNWVIDLGFLNDRKAYHGTLYTDGNTPREIRHRDLVEEQNHKVAVTVMPRGGFVLELHP